MKNKYPPLLLLAAAFTLAIAIAIPSVSADEKTPKGKAPRFKKADTNKDGVVSEGETEVAKEAAKVQRQKRKEAQDALDLEKYDANKNGVLDPDEKATLAADRKADREKKKAEKAAKDTSEH